MVFGNVKHSWTITGLGAYTPRQGTGTLTLTVDGGVRGSAPVAGIGMLRAAIAPVTVSSGQIVRVTATGLAIQDVVADTAWGRLVGLHLASKPWYVEGEKNFSHAAPVYALPTYDAVGGVSYPPLTGLHSSAHTIMGSGHRHRAHHHRKHTRHKHRPHRRHRASGGFG
jgi:hypothetical protein